MEFHWSTKSCKYQVGPKVGKNRVCIIAVWWDGMEMRWCQSTLGSAEYKLPVTLSTSCTQVSRYPHCGFLKICLGLWMRVVRDALGDQEIVWTQRGSWKPRLSECGDVPGGWDRVNSEIHLEAIMKLLGSYTWRPWSIRIGGVLGSSWSEGDWTEGSESGGSQSGLSQCGSCEAGCGRSEGMCDGSWEWIHWSTHNCGNVEYWVQQALLRAGRKAESGRQSILEWCSTQYMQYSVYAVGGVCQGRSMLYSVYIVNGICCTGYM